MAELLEELFKFSARSAPVPYLIKQVNPPDHIWEDGSTKLDVVTDTIVSHHASRFRRLVTPAIAGTPSILPDPTDLSMAITNPDLQTAEVPLISDVWNGNEPINYHAQVYLGTPPKPFYLDLDTGSSLLWVQALLSESDSPVPDQNHYAPSRSLSAQDLRSTSSSSYGDGSSVEVLLFNDAVRVGTLTAERHTIGAAPASGIHDAFKTSKANGILGLGFGLVEGDEQMEASRNLVQKLYDLKKLKHASFAIIGPRNDPKLAAQIDRQAVMQPRGTFVIGSVDPKFYTGSIAWCPQVVATNRWVVKLDKILVNGNVAFEDQYAMIDTGTAYIVASAPSFDKIQSYIPGAAPISSKKNLMFSFPQPSLKSVEFVFGGRSIKLQLQDFGLGAIKDKQGRMCSSIVRLGDAAWPFQDNMWIIGGIFLDNVVTVFDYEARKVGFADISENDLSAAQLSDIQAIVDTPFIANDNNIAAAIISANKAALSSVSSPVASTATSPASTASAEPTAPSTAPSTTLASTPAVSISSTSTAATAPPQLPPLYMGKTPARPNDEAAMSHYKSLGAVYRVSSWVGGNGGGSYTSLAVLTPDAHPRVFRITRHDNGDCISGVEVEYASGIKGSYGTMAGEARTRKDFALQDGEKVVKFEAKAHEHDWFGNSLMVRAIRLSTNQGRTFSVPDSFDAWVAQSGPFVEETVPIDGWELKGWYGGGGDVMDRVGAIWGVALALR